MNEIKITSAPELQLVEESKAEQIKKTFEPMANMLLSFEGDYNSLIQDSKNGIDESITKRAKRLRLDIGKVRIETGKLKDKQKEYIKLEDKAIMGVHNILVWAVKEKEDNLKEIENFFEIQEQKRLEALQEERQLLLSEYVEDANERNLSKFEEDEFQALLAMKKKEHEDRIEAERIAEEQRIEREKKEAQERKRIEEENAKLKAEALKREEEARKETERLAKIEAERLAKEQSERKEREEVERKQREAYEAKLKKEQEEKERIAKELEEKKQAELEAKRKEEERVQAELMKGDSDKVYDLISDLKVLKEKYTFESDNNKLMYKGVNTLLDKVVDYIESKIKH